ncbi:MAG: hypothetical protein M3O74_13755 [Pseudomonadota bacterium]|nr:hypothetical protein [Pseudomonadota bacterium]
MSKITFECIDQNGNPLTISMMAESAAIEEVVAATVQAYKRVGMEVISATRSEELVIDVDLFAAPQRQETISTSALQWLAGRGAKIMQGGAAFSALVLSVIGFDDGFSIYSLSHHLARFADAGNAIMQMVHLG